jgi:glutaredoxin
MIKFEKSENLRHSMTVKTKQIRLFIKPYCGWCQKAMHWLDERDVDYEKIDVIADEAAYDEMIRISGQELAPVIEADREVLADFGPDQLADFFSKLEKKHAGVHSR